MLNVVLSTFHDNRSKDEFHRCLSIDVIASDPSSTTKTSIEDGLSRFFRAKTVACRCDCCGGDRALKTLHSQSRCVSIVAVPTALLLLSHNCAFFFPYSRPKVLLLHLKRFDNALGKNTSRVVFPATLMKKKQSQLRTTNWNCVLATIRL